MAGPDQTRQERRARERVAQKQREAAQRRAAMPWRPLKPVKTPPTWHATAAMAALSAGVGTGAPVPSLFDMGRAAMACIRIFANEAYHATLMPAANEPGAVDLIVVRNDGLAAGEWLGDLARIEQDVFNGGTGAAYREVPASESGLARGPNTRHLRYRPRP